MIYPYAPNTATQTYCGSLLVPPLFCVFIVKPDEVGATSILDALL
jgi:hypothetical protein